jgi:pSer/pThr/pTyr-binding forkhead associated (FHA) protein
VSRPASTPSGGIAEVRLVGPGLDAAIRDTGAHGIGRSRENAFQIDNPTVSRRHARIILSNDRAVAYVQDRGGANGTRLNGEKVEGPELLKEGDSITVGEVTVKVSLRRGA